MKLTAPPDPHRSRTSIWARALLLVTILLVPAGCGNSFYVIKMRSAERRFEEARNLGAEQYAPYEYYSAQARLGEAKRLAAVAEYGTAANLSKEAANYSSQAISIAKEARRKSVAPAKQSADPSGSGQ